MRVLEGDISLDDLNEGLAPGQSSMYGSSTDYDRGQYSEDMRRFRKLALGSQDYPTSEYSDPTSQYGLNQSISSSEGYPTREMENPPRGMRENRGLHSEDIKKFRKPPLGSQEYTSSEYSSNTSQYGLNQTISTTEEYTTREVELPERGKKDTRGFSGTSR